jgi:hypothetical protein
MKKNEVYEPLFRKLVDKPLHVSSVLFEGFPALPRQLQRRVRSFVQELFCYLNVPRVFKLPQVRGLVARRHARLVFEKLEVGAFNHVKVHHYG